MDGSLSTAAIGPIDRLTEDAVVALPEASLEEIGIKVDREAGLDVRATLADIYAGVQVATRDDSRGRSRKMVRQYADREDLGSDEVGHILRLLEGHGLVGQDGNRWRVAAAGEPAGRSAPGEAPGAVVEVRREPSSRCSTAAERRAVTGCLDGREPRSLVPLLEQPFDAC